MAKGRVVRIKRDIPECWEEAMQQFLYLKKAEGKSERTQLDYRKHISQFFKRYPKVYSSGKFNKAILEHMAQSMKPATYNLRLIYLKTFFAWGVKEGIFQVNPLDGFKKRKDEGRIVNLDAEIITKLITLPNKKTYAGLRDYALIILTLDTGIRPNEAHNLLIEDINLRSLEVHIRPEISKTRVSRTVPISPITGQAIRNLIQNRHSAWKNNIPVFASCEGTPLNTNSWGNRMELYSNQLGVWIRPYDLRHAFALQYLRNGGHALALQRTLGHADLTMTKRYVALTQHDLKDQHAIASPLNTLLPQKHRVRKVKR